MSHRLPKPDEKKDVPLAANSFTFGTGITEASYMSPFRFSAQLASPLSAAGGGPALSQRFIFGARNTNDDTPASSLSSSCEESFWDHSLVGASAMLNSNPNLNATTQTMNDAEKEEDLVTRFGRSSPDPFCSICLGIHENISHPNKCLHSFCHICILEWSKVKAECPLCKRPFNSIIYNVRPNQDYDEHNIPVAEQGVYHARPSLMFRLRGPPPLASDMFRSQASQRSRPLLQQILSERLARRHRLRKHEVSSAPAPNEIPLPAPHKPGSSGVRQAAAALSDDGQSKSNVRLPSMLSSPSNDEEKDIDIVQVVRPSSKDRNHQ